MTKRKNSRGQKPHRERRLSIRAVRREKPDVQKLGRALIELAIAQAEADAQLQTTEETTPAKKREVTDD